MKSALWFGLVVLLIAPGTLNAQVIDLRPTFGDDIAEAMAARERLRLQKEESELRQRLLQLQIDEAAAKAAAAEAETAEGEAETTGPEALFVESVLTGQTLQCIYDWAGSKWVRTVKAYQLCPLSIKVEP